MTKSTNKTIWTLALVAILGFLAYKLWPAIKNKINGGAGSGGAIGGTTAGNPYNPYGSGQGGPAPGGGAGLGGSQSGGYGGGSGLGNWISQVLNQGYYNASELGSASDLESSDAAGLGDLDAAGLPLANVPGYGDIDQFLVTQDVPGSDPGAYGIDTTSVDLGGIDVGSGGYDAPGLQGNSDGY